LFQNIKLHQNMRVRQKLDTFYATRAKTRHLHSRTSVNTIGICKLSFKVHFGFEPTLLHCDRYSRYHKTNDGKANKQSGDSFVLGKLHFHHSETTFFSFVSISLWINPPSMKISV